MAASIFSLFFRICRDHDRNPILKPDTYYETFSWVSPPPLAPLHHSAIT